MTYSSETQISHKEVINVAKRRCFLRSNSPNRIRFDLFIMFLATINCFMVPYQAAFSDPNSSNLTLDVMNGIIDVFFMLDILVNFRTSYIKESTNEEIFDLKKIAIQYMKGRFWIDLLASVPVDFVTLVINSGSGDSFIFRLFGLLKLIRLLR